MSLVIHMSDKTNRQDIDCNNLNLFEGKSIIFHIISTMTLIVEESTNFLSLCKRFGLEDLRKNLWTYKIFFS
jgi:hypothetical protein